MRRQNNRKGRRCATSFRGHAPTNSLNPAVRTDPLALIRGTTEFVTTIYGPAVTFAFSDVKVEM